MSDIEELLKRADAASKELPGGPTDDGWEIYEHYVQDLVRDLAAALRERLTVWGDPEWREINLIRERDELRADYRELQDENAMIQEESAERKRERDRLREENSRLRVSSKFAQKLDIIDQLRAELTRVEEENRRLSYEADTATSCLNGMLR